MDGTFELQVMFPCGSKPNEAVDCYTDSPETQVSDFAQDSVDGAKGQG